MEVQSQLNPIQEILDTNLRNVFSCLEKLNEHDFEFFKNNVHERSITFKLGFYLQEIYPDWDVDCEYNRKILDVKRVADEQRFPDIIVHKRNRNDNFIVIEAKKDGSVADLQEDERKVKNFLTDEEFNYTFGLVVNFKSDFNHDMVWFSKNALDEIKKTNFTLGLLRFAVTPNIYEGVGDNTAPYNYNLVFPKDDLFDPFSQFISIKKMILQLNTMESFQEREIRLSHEQVTLAEGEEKNFAYCHSQESLIDTFHDDAARSMAVISMLAPFVESLFHKSFLAIGKIVDASSGKTEKWDCHYFTDNGKEIKYLVNGIVQIIDRLSIRSYFPQDLQYFLEILFKYRNNMFHNGFEWSNKDCQKFKNFLESKNCLSWFATCSLGSKDWMFYSTDEFHDKVIEIIELTFRGLIQSIREIKKRQFSEADEK